MANAIPSLMCVNYKGGGNVAVYKLLNGLTLDPVQDGNDVLTGTLEVPNATSEKNFANRLVEAFGKRYLLHGFRVYERDQGGAGNWGEVTGLALDSTSAEHSGLHLLHPGGVPTLAFMCGIASVLHVVYTTNGTSWTDLNTGLDISTSFAVGGSIVHRTAIYWWRRGGDGVHTRAYDFQTGSAVEIPEPSVSGAAAAPSQYHVHQGKLFAVYKNITNEISISRLDGTSYTLLDSPSAVDIHNSSSPTMFSDGDDLIVAYANNSSATQVFRYTQPLINSTNTEISSAWSGISHGSIATWTRYVSIDPDPRLPTVYLWLNNGNHNTGSFDLYRYRYRQITHGSVTNGPFEVGETVEDQTTGATGRIMESSGSALDLTDVVGTFGNGNTIQQITGTNNTATATTTSLLVEQSPVFIGNGVSAVNFGIPDTTDGGLERIPVKGAARPDWDGQPIEEAGGVTRWYFRVYGTGTAVNLAMYLDDGERAPDQQATLVNGSLTVESGTPSTTPTITNGLTIDNVTPDDGATLYSFQHDANTDNIAEGDGYTTILDIA